MGRIKRKLIEDLKEVELKFKCNTYNLDLNGAYTITVDDDIRPFWIRNESSNQFHHPITNMQIAQSLMREFAQLLANDNQEYNKDIAQAFLNIYDQLADSCMYQNGYAELVSFANDLILTYEL